MAGSRPPHGPGRDLVVGVLALQGAFREHGRILSSCGASVRQVRLAADLTGLDALVIPGGESTTMGRLIRDYALLEPLRAFGADRPILGTCAGMVMLARRTVGRPQTLLGLADIEVRRNAFGRQVHSFEGEVTLHVPGISADRPYTGVFIRAPWVEQVGPGVEVLATYDGHIVGIRDGHLIGLSFHPELTEDVRLHEYFLGAVRASLQSAEARTVHAVTPEV